MAVLKIFVLFVGLLGVVQANLEVCACCGDQTGQPVSDKCEIPARRFTEKELVSLEILCNDQDVPDPSFDPDYRYGTRRDLKYIVKDGSYVSYHKIENRNCYRISDEWKNQMFWIPENASWILTDEGALLSRKVVNVLDSNNETIFQWLTYSQGINYHSLYTRLIAARTPNLDSFDGTYEFVVRIIPSSKIIHDIEYFNEKKTELGDPVFLGKLTFDVSKFSPGYGIHLQVLSKIYFKFDFDTNYQNLEIQDENQTFFLQDSVLRKDLYVERVTNGMVLFPEFFELSWVYGRNVRISKDFKANVTTILLDSDPVNEALKFEEEITGEKVEITMDSFWPEPADEIESYLMVYLNDARYLSVTDRAMAIGLFILAGILLLGSVYVCMKKCCCCCVRDRVTPGYTPIVET